MPPCNCHPPFPRPEPFSPLPRPGRVPDWGKWIRDRLAEKGALLVLPTRASFPNPGAWPNLYLDLETGAIYRWDRTDYAVLVDPQEGNDVLVYDSVAAFPDEGEQGKLYIAANTGNLYRWGGEGYVALLPGKADKAAPQAAGNFAALTQDGNLADSGKKPSDFVGKAALFDNPDTNPTVKSSLLPSYVDDVVEYASLSAFPQPGETGKIYVALDTNIQYRWSGTQYTEIAKIIIPSTSAPLVDGAASAGSSEAYSRGDHRHPTDTTRASVADVTLTERFSAWTFSGDVEAGSQYEVRFDFDYQGTTLWALYEDGGLLSTGSDDPLSTSEDFPYGETSGEYTITATRTALPGYRLGPDEQTNPNRDKPVASEAEAEALRQGKQDKLTFDNAPTSRSNNPVKSSGIWSAIWGALASLPTGFSSLYDWCVAQLAGKATKADATLTERGLSKWNVVCSDPAVRGVVEYDGEARKYKLYDPDYQGFLFDETEAIWPEDSATSLQFSYLDTDPALTFVATREALPGYVLGSDDPSNPNRDKPLASEAEAEALRNGKQNALTPAQLANIAAVSDALAFDATHTYEAGDPVVYDGTLYTFTAAHTGAWTGSDVSAVDIIARLAGKLDKSGDTMSGDLTFDDGVGDSQIKIKDADGYPLRIDAQGIIVGKWNDNENRYDYYRINWPDATDYGTLALVAPNPTAGNLAALDAQGNPTDSGVEASDKLDSTSAAPAFSSSSSTQYAVGSHVTYNGKLYVCTTATTGGTWVAASWKADTMTDPDAVLDITAQNQLRVVAKDGTLLWAQGYDLASTSSATLACDAVNNFTFADGATSQAFALPTAPSGKAGDFGLDIDNSANTGAATLTLTGLDTAFSVVIPKGESLTDMLSIAAGELARFYISLSTFRVNNLPTWHIVKQIVENGGATT